MNIVQNDKWAGNALGLPLWPHKMGTVPTTKTTEDCRRLPSPQCRLPMSHWIIMIDFYYMELQFILLNNKQPNEQASPEGGGACDALKAWQQQAWPKSVSKIWMKSYKEITLFIIRIVVQPAGETKRHETTDIENSRRCRQREKGKRERERKRDGNRDPNLPTAAQAVSVSAHLFGRLSSTHTQTGTLTHRQSHTDTHTHTVACQVSSVFSL